MNWKLAALVWRVLILAVSLLLLLAFIWGWYFEDERTAEVLALAVFSLMLGGNHR